MKRSLQKRLGIGLLLSLLATFFVLWLVISQAIEAVAQDYVSSRLQHDSETLLSALTITESGLSLTPERVDSIYQRPFSGHYYKIRSADSELRSRSLWDQDLSLPPSVPEDAVRLPGPAGQSLLTLIRSYNKQGHTITIAVAEDLTALAADIAAFNRRFTAAAVVLLALLIGVQVLIVRRALRSLQHTRDELGALERGQIRQLSTEVPAEIAPLVGEVNRLLDLMGRRLQRSRNALGDLAHALKKPLTVLQQLEGDELGDHPSAQQAVMQQTQVMQRTIDRVLKRARLAGSGPIGAQFVAAVELPPLFDTLRRLHRDKTLVFETQLDPELIVPLDREDLLEILGNLLDNACKWAQGLVRLVMSYDHGLHLIVEDDGPGVDEALRAQLTQRGRRLDETVIGHGLGLAIVQDSVGEYGGTVQLDRSPLGGLRVTIDVPASV